MIQISNSRKFKDYVFPFLRNFFSVKSIIFIYKNCKCQKSFSDTVQKRGVHSICRCDSSIDNENNEKSQKSDNENHDLDSSNEKNSLGVIELLPASDSDAEEANEESTEVKDDQCRDREDSFEETVFETVEILPGMY